MLYYQEELDMDLDSLYADGYDEQYIIGHELQYLKTHFGDILYEGV